MQNINVKLNIKTILVFLFFATIFGAILGQSYIFSFIASQSGTAEIEDSQKASKETTDLLLSLDKIAFDTSVLNSPYLDSLSPLPNFPLDAQSLSNFGKANPFLGSFIVVSAPASSSVGSVIYSNQREVNNGSSIRAVSPTRR